MKITTGGYDIFDTGSIISYNSEELIFHLADDLRVKMTFQDDTENKDYRLEFNSIDNNELEMLFINFNNPLGIGNSTPINMGILNARRLYFSYRIHSLAASSSKTIHYTWYLREEVKNG